jgi:hypothetical protein
MCCIAGFAGLSSAFARSESRGWRDGAKEGGALFTPDLHLIYT